MNKVVVDSSVAIKWLVAEPYSSIARNILNDYQAGILTLLAPDLIYAEVGNIVWKKQRFQGLAALDAQQIIDVFRSLTFATTTNETLIDDAYHLAVTYQRTVYDALYLALSLREQCQFVTADERLANALSPTFSNVIWVAKWS
jgi:predicted nucleic acid-binding protein